jgi:hypothetical protein
MWHPNLSFTVIISIYSSEELLFEQVLSSKYQRERLPVRLLFERRPANVSKLGLAVPKISLSYIYRSEGKKNRGM